MKFPVFAPMVALAFVLSGCDQKPPHYYVACSVTDAKGWSLSDYEKPNGYLMACTYMSPDKRQSYTVRCHKDGCD